jgi:hypothetical protein
MIKLEEIMNLLDVTEDDAIKAILNLVSPPPPPATRENWIRLSTFGHSAPSTKELWEKLEDSNFRCHRCGSQMRLSFNHINGNPKDHRLENLEVICYACNRSISNKPTVDKNQHLKVALTAIQIWKETRQFPKFAEIRKKAGVKQIGGATYLLKFIKKRLEEKNNYIR